MEDNTVFKKKSSETADLVIQVINDTLILF